MEWSIVHPRYESAHEVLIIAWRCKGQPLTKLETLAASIHVGNDYRSKRLRGKVNCCYEAWLLKNSFSQNRQK
jgi:hypothetical protein